MHPAAGAAPVNIPTAPTTDRAIETSSDIPLGSRRTLQYSVPWKSPCLADHRARSGHGYRDAPHAPDLQLSTDDLLSYGDSRPLRIVRSLISKAPTACPLGPSPTPSGDGPTPVGVHAETWHPTTDMTTPTCAAAITTSGRCWSGPPVLSGPGPGESCGENSNRSTIALSPGQSTTRSPHTAFRGGNGGSKPDTRAARVTLMGRECNTEDNRRERGHVDDLHPHLGPHCARGLPGRPAARRTDRGTARGNPARRTTGPGRPGPAQDELLQDRTGTRPLSAAAAGGPASATSYLTCAKFVTTPRYAPRLRDRLCVERQLADGAGARGWEREVDRRQRIAERIATLLDDLGEPRDTSTNDEG
jgi:hypothetical protein